MIATRHKSGFYRACFRVHEWMPVIWFLTLVPVGALLIASNFAQSIPNAEIVQRALVWLAVAFFVVAFALQFFAVWHSVVLRQLAWWGARAAGGAWRWLATGWRAPLLLVLGIGWAWRESPRLIGEPPVPWKSLFTVNTTGAIVACVVLFVLALQIFQARRRMTILAFTNHAGEDYKSYVEGLSARLLGELQQLSDLYKVIDAANPPTGPGSGGNAVRRLTQDVQRESTTVGVTASVEDVGAALRGAVTTDAKVKLWFFEMPVGAIAATFARFVQGPRLSGSLHRQGSGLILIARLDAKGQSSGWRVEADASEGTGSATSGALASLTNDLIYRIFTDRVSVGSAKWEAVQLFSEGLRTFRRTLMMQRDLPRRLLQAERLFIRALAEDNTFGRCYYNLGVVYGRLDRDDLARSAYEKALDEGSLLESAYALSQLAWNKGDYATTLHFAQRAIAIRPDHALSWQLAANAQAELQSGGVQIPPRTETAYWRNLTELREIAAALAWRDLCRSALRGQPLGADRRAVEACFGDLAATHIINGNPRRGRLMLTQVLTQTNAPDFYFYRGVSWMGSGRDMVRAAREFHRASLLEEGPNSRNYLHRLCRAEATNYARRRQPQARERAVQAYRRLMECPSNLDKDLLSDLANACLDIGKTDLERDDQQKIAESGMLAQRTRLAIWTREQISPRPTNERLRRLARHIYHKLAKLDPDSDPSGWGWGWSFGMIATELASALPAGEEKIELLASASNWLRAYSRELVSQQVLLNYAEALLEAEKNIEALEIARRAVWLNPVSARERLVLGNAYLALQDYRRAEPELLISFDLDPSNQNTARAMMRLHRGIDSNDKTSRRQAQQRVLNNIQEMIERAADQEVPGLHYLAGLFHFQLMQNDQAQTELSIARTHDYQPLSSRLFIAACLIEQKAYNQAETQLETLIKEVRAQYRAVLEEEKGLPADARSDRRKRKLAASRYDEEMSFHELMFLAYHGLIAVYLERGGDVERAQRALALSRSHLERSSKEARQEADADYGRSDGWISHQLGDLTPAYEKLQQSLRQWEEPETHYRLATVCLAQAQVAKTPAAQKERWLNRAQEHSGKAVAIDLRGSFDDRAEALEGRIAKARRAK